MSLRRFMLLLTTIIILMLLLVFGISLRLLQQDAEQLRVREESDRLALNTEFMRQRIQLYRDIVSAYGEDQGVRDLLTTPSPEKAMQWSKAVRAALPYASGAALISNDGDFSGDPVAQPAHLDFTEPVHDETGARIGMVLITFSLDPVIEGLEHLADSDRALRLLEQDGGRVIAHSANWDSMQDQHIIESGLPDTGWRLEMKLQHPLLPPRFAEVSVVLMSGMVLLIGLVLLFSRFLSRRYLTEVENLRDILRTSKSGDGARLQLLASGPSLFPIGSSLSEELAELDDERRKLHLKSHTDSLTGVANRRAFDTRLASLLGDQDRAVGNFCLVLFDLDAFMPITDAYGQAVGDRLLQTMAEALRSQVRPSDLVSRWGGDEFAVLLPNMGRAQLDPWLARVRTLFTQAQMDIPELAATEPCTVSVGFVCITRGERRSAGTLLQQADERLYQEKETRRPRPAVGS